MFCDLLRHRVSRAAQAAAVALSFLFIFAIVALAQDRQTQGSFAQDHRQNTPGQFDFYVLALSWSQSYCEAAHERAPDRAPDQQCAGRPFSFVVHGLWPQYEQGFPSFCQVPAPRLDRAIVRKARAGVKIPAEFIELGKPIMVKPDDVAEAFVKANAGLSRASLAVACDSKRLSEVRVCFTKDFSFRECSDVARRACKGDAIVLPAVRGG